MNGGDRCLLSFVSNRPKFTNTFARFERLSAHLN